MQGIENLVLNLSNHNDSFRIDDAYLPDGSLAPSVNVSVYGHDGSDSITVNSLSGPTTIVGGNGDDTVTVTAPTNDLTNILNRLTVNGNSDLARSVVAVNDNDPNPLVAQFLTQPAIVIATGNPVAVPGQPGQFYYQAAFVPILVDTNPSSPGSQVDVRTVVLDSTGNLVKKLVQIKGTPEYGVRAYGRQASNAVGLLWLDYDADGNQVQTHTNTGVPDIIFEASTVPTAKKLYYDQKGNATTDSSITGLPAIIPATSTDAGRAAGLRRLGLPARVRPVRPEPDRQRQLRAAGADERHGQRLDDLQQHRRRGLALTGRQPRLLQVLRRAVLLLHLQPGLPARRRRRGQHRPDDPADADGPERRRHLLRSPSTSRRPPAARPAAATRPSRRSACSPTARRSTRPRRAASRRAQYRTFTAYFTATSDKAVLAFAAERYGDDSSFTIDNITVREVHVPAYVVDFASPSAVNLYIDNAGRQVSQNTGRPALLRRRTTSCCSPFAWASPTALAERRARRQRHAEHHLERPGGRPDDRPPRLDGQHPGRQLCSGQALLHGSACLTSAISSTATTLTVASAAGFPASGPFQILIDNERLTVTVRLRHDLHRHPRRRARPPAGTPPAPPSR